MDDIPWEEALTPAEKRRRRRCWFVVLVAPLLASVIAVSGFVVVVRFVSIPLVRFTLTVAEVVGASIGAFSAFAAVLLLHPDPYRRGLKATFAFIVALPIYGLCSTSIMAVITSYRPSTTIAFPISAVLLISSAALLASLLFKGRKMNDPSRPASGSNEISEPGA